MGERIKALRLALGLTQQEFAERLGVKRNTIAQYEIGRNEPIETVMVLICREFHVNEEWLRTGKGEMFLPRTRDDELAAFFGDVLSGTPDFRQRFIAVLSRLTVEQWEMLEDMANKLVEELQKKEEPNP